MSSSLLTFLISTVAAVAAAPLVGMLATRLGVVDKPDGHRKLHARPVPLTGGPTLMASIFTSVAATLWIFPDLLLSTSGDLRFLASLAVASMIIIGVGLLDDRFGLRGRQKLFGQFVAALVMVPSGITIQQASLFGVPIEFGDFSSFVTVFWILGAINALNLIDGVDGLASTTGIVLSLSVAAVTWITGGRPDGLLISLALAGALSGFLVYNFPPARMFLGDSGSMLIGLVLGCVALKCSVKQYAAVALIMPTAIWAIPIFDVSMAIVRRRLTGRSIYTTDRGHLHHCLVRQGHTGAGLLVIVGFLCSLTGLGAIAAAAFENELIAIVAVLTAIALLVVTRTFGHAELTLLTNRVRRFAGSLLKRSHGVRPVLHHEQVRLHGEHTWETLWTRLVQFASDRQLDRAELMIHLPSFGEEYHGTWQTKSRCDIHQPWRTEIPLIVDGVRAGHIKLSGMVEDQPIGDWLMTIADGLREFDVELQSIMCDLREKRRARPLPDVVLPLSNASLEGRSSSRNWVSPLTETT